MNVPRGEGRRYERGEGDVNRRRGKIKSDVPIGRNYKRSFSVTDSLPKEDSKIGLTFSYGSSHLGDPRQEFMQLSICFEVVGKQVILIPFDITFTN